MLPSTLVRPHPIKAYVPSDSENMKKAIRACLNNEMTTRQAALVFNVARSTLDGRLKSARESTLDLDKEFPWHPVNMQKAIQVCLAGVMNITDAYKVFNVPKTTLASRLRTAREMKMTPDQVPVQHYMHSLKKAVKNRAVKRVRGYAAAVQETTKNLYTNDIETTMTDIISNMLSDVKAADCTLYGARNGVPVQDGGTEKLVTDGKKTNVILHELIERRISKTMGTTVETTNSELNKNTCSYSDPIGIYGITNGVSNCARECAPLLGMGNVPPNHKERRVETSNHELTTVDCGLLNSVLNASTPNNVQSVNDSLSHSPDGVPDHVSDGVTSSTSNIYHRVPFLNPGSFPIQELSMENVFANNNEMEMTQSTDPQHSSNEVFWNTNCIPDLVPYSSPDRVPNGYSFHAPESFPMQELSLENIFLNTKEMGMDMARSISYQLTGVDDRISTAETTTSLTVPPEGFPSGHSYKASSNRVHNRDPGSFPNGVPDYVSDGAPSRSIKSSYMQGRTTKFVFTHHEEVELTRLIVSMSSRLYGIDMEDIQRIAYEHAEALNIVQRPISSYYTNKWVIGLTKRNPPLQFLNQNYAAEHNEKALIVAFFRKLRTIYRKRRILSERIYNTEAYAINLTKKTEIIEMKGEHLKSMMSNAKNFASFQICVNANGAFMPPKLILPIKQPAPRIVLPEEGTVELEDTGFISKRLFLKWFDDFVKFTQPTQQNPVLLLLDARFGYLRSLEFFKRAKLLHVEILCFPPNTAHILQPLDVSFFAPMRNYYSKTVQNINLTGQRADEWASLTLENMAPGLFTASYTRAATKQTGIDGFRNTGILPFDPNQSIKDFLTNESAIGRTYARPGFRENSLLQPTETNDDCDTDDGFEGEIAAFVAQRKDISSS